MMNRVSSMQTLEPVQILQNGAYEISTQTGLLALVKTRPSLDVCRGFGEDRDSFHVDFLASRALSSTSVRNVALTTASAR